MKRLNTISTFDKTNVTTQDYIIPTYSDFPPSVVDKSFFVPDAEAVKRLASAPKLSSDEVRSMYDFPNGDDDGSPMPLTRRPGADLAELSNSILEKQSDISARLSALEHNNKVQNEINSLQTSQNS